MMKSSSPVSPGGSVLDRILMLEEKEKKLTEASSPLVIITKSPKHESLKYFEAPFSPQHGNTSNWRSAPSSDVAKSPKHESSKYYEAPFSPHEKTSSRRSAPFSDVLSVGTPLDRATDPTSHVNKRKVAVSESPTPEQTMIKLKPVVTFGKSPTSDRTPNFRQVTINKESTTDQMPNLKSITFSKSPKSDDSQNWKPVTFSRSPRSDQTPNSKPDTDTFSRSPKSNQTINLKSVAFSKSPKLDQTLNLKSATSAILSKSPNIDQIPPKLMSATFSKSPKSDQVTPNFKPSNFSISPNSDQATPNFKPVTVSKSLTSYQTPSKLLSANFSKSPKSDQATPNLKPVTFSKSLTSDQTLSKLLSANFSKSPKSDKATPNFKPVTFSKSPTSDQTPNFRSFPVTSRDLLTTKNESHPSPEMLSPPRNLNALNVRHQRNQFKDLSVGIINRSGEALFFEKEEASIEEIAWLSDDLLHIRKEAAVEEMPWPSEGLEEFPNVSWLSSGDDVDEGMQGDSSSSSFTFDNLADPADNTENEGAFSKDITSPSQSSRKRPQNTIQSPDKFNWQQRNENTTPTAADRSIASSSEATAGAQQFLPVECHVSILDIDAPKTAETNPPKGSLLSGESRAKNLTAPKSSGHRVTHSLDTIQALEQKGEQEGRTLNDSVALDDTTTNSTRDKSDHWHLQSRRSNNMQEKLQEREEEDEQQRSESPSRVIRYRPPSRLRHDDYSLASLDDAMTVNSSITAKSNLTVSTDGSTPFSPRSRRMIHAQDLEQEGEEDFHKGDESPARLARHTRASRLRSRNSPMPTNSFYVKSNQLTTQVNDYEEFKVSDSDGPPKIFIEPGKLTAGIRPRSVSPAFVPQRHSFFSSPPSSKKNGSLTGSDNMSSPLKKLKFPFDDTENTHHTLKSQKDDSDVAQYKDFENNARVAGKSPMQSCDEDSNNQDATAAGQDFAKEGIANQASTKVPRSLAHRREPFNTQLGKSLTRSSIKSLTGSTSHEDDTYSVATDSTPITRPGRPLLLVDKPSENVQSRLLDNMASRIAQGEHNKKHESSPPSDTEMQTSSTTGDVVIRLAENSYSSSQERFNPSIGNSEVTVSNSIDSSPISPPPESPSPFFSPHANTTRKQQVETEVEKNPKEQLYQIGYSSRTERTQQHVSKVGVREHIVLTSPMAVLNQNLAVWMNSRPINNLDLSSAQKQQQNNTSPTRNKKATRKKKQKTPKLDYIDSPTSGSSCSSTSRTNESTSATSLSSWWQSTYAAAQQPEVNKLVEQALLEQAVSPTHCTIKRRSGQTSPEQSRAKGSSPHPSSRAIVSSARSPVAVIKTSSPGMGSSASSCGNEGDSEGGSFGLLVESVTSSHASNVSRHSDSKDKMQHETDDDDIFSGIEDDDQSLGSKLERDNIDVQGTAKNDIFKDNATGDVMSMKETSASYDTHTTDLLNSLDDDNSRIAKPLMRFFPQSPRETPRRAERSRNSVKDSSAAKASSPESPTVDIQSPHQETREERQDFLSKEGTQMFESLWDINDGTNVDIQGADVKQEKAEKTSSTKYIEQFSCAFLEGYVMQFCQDPKAATSIIISGFCEQPKASPEYRDDNDIQNEEEPKDREANALSSSLSEKEKFVWKVWDEKDESSSPKQKVKNTIAHTMNTVTHDSSSSENNVKAESSQEKSLPKDSIDEKNTEHHTASEAEAEDSSSMAPPPPPLKSPKSSPTRITQFIRGKSPSSFKNMPSSPAKSVTSLVSPRSSRAGQKQLLDRFCWKLRNDGMEILKLNSDKIWQVRFLTVSKEVTWLTDESDGDAAGDRGQCPKGLLWVKKNTSIRDQSVYNIEKNGKGGVLFSEIASFEELAGRHIPMSKKQLQGKFKDSAIVVLKTAEEAGSKIVYLRCRTRQEALVLCAGCNMIGKMLHDVKKLPPLAVAPLKPAGLDHADQKSKDQVIESKKAEIEGDNDLWEV